MSNVRPHEMRLSEAIASIDRSHDNLCIVAKRPWTHQSEAKLVQLTEDYRVPNDVVGQGYEYFLEVSVALDEVLGGLDGTLSEEQLFRAVLYYAENDAYPEWLCALRDQREL